MKKFVSMAMVAAMTTSMVPATAFAKGEVTATAKIIDALELTKDEAKTADKISESTYANEVPELQLKITDVDYRTTNPGNTDQEVTLTLDNAVFDFNDDGKFDAADTALLAANIVSVRDEDGVDKLSASTTDTSYENLGTSKVGATHIYDGADYTEISAVPAQDEETAPAAWADNSSTGAHLSSDGTATGTIVTVSEIDVPAAGTESIAYMMDEMAETLDFSGCTNALYFNDGTNPAVEIATTAGFNTANCADVDALLAMIDAVAAGGGAQFEDGSSSAVTLGNSGYVIALDSTAIKADYATAFAVDVDDVIATEYSTYTRGDFTPATVTTHAAGTDAADYLVNTAGTHAYAKEVAGTTTAAAMTVTAVVEDEDEVTFTFSGAFEKDDVIKFDLTSVLDKTGVNSTATVSVSGDLVEVDDLVYVSVLGRNITATVKEMANVAEEERVNLERDLKIKSAVGDFVQNQKIELKLSNGFEFGALKDKAGAYSFHNKDEDYVELQIDAVTPGDEIVIDAADFEIEAVSAKSGAVATLTVKATDEKIGGAAQAGAFDASTKVEIAKVVDYVVELSVDEDEDIPVIYSGVNVENDGITDDSDHMSLEVTAEESFPGAWSMRKGFNFELPDGVYVTDVDVIETKNFYVNGVTNEADDVAVRDAFWNAYQDGDHKNFEFEKRVFDDVDNDLRNKECATMTFQLELVADPGFVGDVNLKLTGDLVDEQEVTIAKFATPFYVEAEQNDLKIDYRYTDIPTDITITEAEAGLWDKDNAQFYFYIEGGHMTFEDDPTFDVTGGMELKDDEIVEIDVDADGKKEETLSFTVDEESDEAATVTITDMQLYMERNIPAGPYDLEIATSMGAGYITETLFAPDEAGEVVVDPSVADNGTGAHEDAPAKGTGAAKFGVTAWAAGTTRPATTAAKEDSYIDDVADFSKTVKEAFVNVVTAGREQDDASFTTKVVVPVGESYIVAGENQVTLDVPAYVSAAGYTMLPVRAVATALGINNNNVIWNGETKTVTILYGQRIITMVAGQKVVNVNGSVIPASAAVEIVDGRTFLPMRDLATALGVTDITWDAATKTATLNGGVVAE